MRLRCSWVGFAVLAFLAACGGQTADPVAIAGTGNGGSPGAGGAAGAAPEAGGGGVADGGGAAGTGVDASDGDAGASGSDTGTGGSPTDGGPCPVETIATGEHPWAIATDATNVYYTTYGMGLYGAVHAIPLAGGPSVSLASKQVKPGAIALDAKNVYFVAGPELKRVAKSGGAVQTLASFTEYLRAVAAREQEGYAWVSDGASIVRYAAGGGPGQVVATGQQDPVGIALDESFVYWVSSNDGTVAKAPKNGGTTTLLATGAIHPQAIAIRGASLFWSVAGGGQSRVYRFDLDGATKVPVELWTGGGASAAAGIAVDASGVYFATGAGGAVLRTGLDGGPAATVAAGQGMPRGVALSATHVYFTDQQNDVVRKACKPFN